jgi:hypothetical protein
MNRRQFVGTSAAIAAGALSTTYADEPSGGTLYNGIKLPSVWPPKWKELPAKPVMPPYLESPPAIIPIDLGRQLFVDDFLIEHSTLKRIFHQPREHKNNPLLRPDQPWEQVGASPMAMPFSDGVWYDPKDRLFKMWYMGGYGQAVCLAFSEDGVRWTKPKFDVKKGTNITHPGPRDSATVWLSSHESDPKRRFVLFRSHSDGKRFGQSLHFSPDGIHWSERILRTGSTGDRTTAFYNPFRKVWVYSIRHGWGLPRRRRYWETTDLVKGPMWNAIDEPGMWVGSDSLDHQRDDLKTVPQLYNLDCVAYESLLLGMFSIWRGDKNIPAGRPKPNDICLGFSRDGFYWDQPDRRAFIGVSEKPGDWNWGNVQSVGGCCLVVGDELWFYHSGRASSPGGKGNRDAGGAAGLAILRRDGFASLDAGEQGGAITTRPLQFKGKHLFVNADVKDGELTAEVLDRNGQVIAGFAKSDCVACRADRTKQRLAWKKGDLNAVAGMPVKFRFHLKNARMYAFWVSSGESGASTGFVAAGGPGLTDRDA